MSFVKGDSRSARELAKFLKGTMTDIEGCCESIQKSCSSLEGAWRDEGVSEVRESVNVITKGVKESTGDYLTIYNALMAYADFLDN